MQTKQIVLVIQLNAAYAYFNLILRTVLALMHGLQRHMIQAKMTGDFVNLLLTEFNIPVFNIQPSRLGSVPEKAGGVVLPVPVL